MSCSFNVLRKINGPREMSTEPETHGMRFVTVFFFFSFSLCFLFIAEITLNNRQFFPLELLSTSIEFLVNIQTTIFLVIPIYDRIFIVYSSICLGSFLFSVIHLCHIAFGALIISTKFCALKSTCL